MWVISPCRAHGQGERRNGRPSRMGGYVRQEARVVYLSPECCPTSIEQRKRYKPSLSHPPKEQSSKGQKKRRQKEELKKLTIEGTRKNGGNGTEEEGGDRGGDS